MFTDEAVLFAFGLTLLAGLATGLGSALAFFTRQTNTRFLSLALGFSAGVMLYVSFVEILPQAQDVLVTVMGKNNAYTLAVLSFFGGILLTALIDKLVPAYENPHQVHVVEEMDVRYDSLPKNTEHDFAKLKRTGLLAALAIAVHNFPEGIATFTAALTDPQLGIAIAVAIAIHNIPEGIAVSIPLYFATGNRGKAFGLSFLSGLAEPLGAVVDYFLLMPFLTPTVFGIIFAGVAGIMVFISLDELLPAAQEYGEHHLCTYGLIAGMGVMALSLVLLKP